MKGSLLAVLTRSIFMVLQVKMSVRHNKKKVIAVYCNIHVFSLHL